MEANMKENRQRRILELIAAEQIETQEELAERLKSEGFQVTQATVSRDIRTLQLSKMADSSGRQYYTAGIAKNNRYNVKYIRALRDGYVSGTAAQNLIVIKTVAGMAMAVAAAIDALELENVLGCIAGDDTIFCAVTDNAHAVSVLEKIEGLVS